MGDLAFCPNLPQEPPGPRLGCSLFGIHLVYGSEQTRNLVRDRCRSSPIFPETMMTSSPRPATARQLIFLISQPRSGSSLVQQILLQSERIVSFPEPWLMLPLVYTFKDSGMSGVYNPHFAQVNLQEHLERYPDGLPRFQSEIRDLALRVYGWAKPASDQLVLDKTPRYYHILRELQELFPEARFVLLTRNPVATFASMLQYNFGGDLEGLLSSTDRMHDLVTGPQTLAHARVQGSPNTHFIKYEDVVLKSATTLRELATFLEIDGLTPRYHLAPDFRDSRGVDLKSVQHHTAPVTDYLDSWRIALDSSEKRATAIRTLEAIGEQALQALGYDLHELVSNIFELDQHAHE